MAPSSTLPPEAEATLSRDGTVITGNQRAARTIRLAYDHQRRSHGSTTWEPPSIYAWDSFTAHLWHKALLSGAVDKLLLNGTQELQLWRSIISSDPRWTSLRSVESLATMAARAWQLLCSYRGQSRLKALGVSEDTRAFQRWAQSFARRCQADGYLPQAQLENALAALDLEAPGELYLIGFDSRTPAQTALLDTLQLAGARIIEQAKAPIAEHLQLMNSATLEDELTDAAWWLRDTLATNPNARIAVIHPDIASERAEVGRVFRRVLAPELESIMAGPASGPFEFSLGRPLSLSPMIAVALSILRWASTPIAIEELSQLLLSPYFTPASELQLRAGFDAYELRQSTVLRPELSLEGLISRIEDHSKSMCPRGLLSQLHSLKRTLAKFLPAIRQKSHADWADNIRELLQSSGWASFHRDDSVEFQTRNKWEASLDQLATLDFEGTRPNFAEAVAQLEGILQRTLFAAESYDAPIQVMSPQEAAGSNFDALYFVRASDLNWPAIPGTDPLLGWRLQRDLAMPGSDALVDLTHTKAIIARLASSAATVVFSYARETIDGHQRLSPLLADLALDIIPAPSIPESLTPVQLEEIEDPGDIPLANPKVRGGASVLKLQAACGFRAFAESRLHSTPLDTPEAGMDAAERGSIVHATMAHLWIAIKTQAALRSLTPDERIDHLDRAITSALKSASKYPVSPWEDAYIEIQHERLRRLILPWLDEELRRSSFAVNSTEQKFTELALGPLTLDIRIDRIDTMLDDHDHPSGEVLLDYKTGDARTTHWDGDRPDDPQLPLYAVLSDSTDLAALGFILMRPGRDLGLRGFARDEGILPKPFKPTLASLEDHIAEWRRVLVNLAEEYAGGDARVRPKVYPTTCGFCKQRILCRLDPATFEDDLDDNGDAKGDAAYG